MRVLSFRRERSKFSNSARGITAASWMTLPITLMLAAMIFLFPIRRPSYYWTPFQSISFFGNGFIPFSLLYFLFFAFVVVQAITLGEDPKSKVVGAILILTVSLVIVGFWLLKIPTSPVASFDDGGETNTLVLLNHGFLPGRTEARSGYFEYPALAILGSVSSLISGLNISAVAKFLSMIGTASLCVSFYVLAAKIMGSIRKGVMVALCAIVGNVTLYAATYFRPDTFGFFFFIPFFALLANRSLETQNSRRSILFIVIFFALALDDLIYFISFFVIMVCVLIGESLLNRNSFRQLGLILLILLTFVAMRIFINYDYTIIYLWNAFESLLHNPFSIFSLSAIFSYANAYLGPSAPLWAVLTREFWLTLTLLGTVSAFIILARGRHHANTFELRASLFFVGVVLVSLLILPLDVKANRTVGTFLILSPFMAILVGANYAQTSFRNILHYVEHRFGFDSYRNYMAILAVLLIVLSLPSFMALNPTPNTDFLYQQDYETVTFSLTHYTGSSIYIDSLTLLLARYYFTNVSFSYVPDPRQAGITQDQYFGIQLPALSNSYAQSEGVLFISTPRITQIALSVWGASPNSIEWRAFYATLRQGHIVYTNGFDTLYISRGQ